MSNLNQLISNATQALKDGLCPLCNGWKQNNNISNQDFISIVQHFSTLLENYHDKNKDNESLITLAINDFKYNIEFLTDRWSHKENSEVPNKFMIHNPISNKWRKRTNPDNSEISVICDAIVYSLDNS